MIIETPKDSRNKYTYDERLNLFKLKNVLPAGASFPYDFGFLPGTLGEDGDALDVLVLMDESAFAGCLVPARLIGVIEADQTEDGGKRVTNDRIIAVSANSPVHSHITSLRDVGKNLLLEIEHFFDSYNRLGGRAFKVTGRLGTTRALEVIRRGEKLYRSKI
ncbi:MAG TPA: inorganic diphosphatase [Patescibacteria group bacterium]|nr:inorganic diphosphatase [Patescibacteria group bacterium]